MVVMVEASVLEKDKEVEVEINKKKEMEVEVVSMMSSCMEVWNEYSGQRDK